MDRSGTATEKAMTDCLQFKKVKQCLAFLRSDALFTAVVALSGIDTDYQCRQEKLLCYNNYEESNQIV